MIDDRENMHVFSIVVLFCVDHTRKGCEILRSGTPILGVRGYSCRGRVDFQLAVRFTRGATVREIP